MRRADGKCGICMMRPCRCALRDSDRRSIIGFWVAVLVLAVLAINQCSEKHKPQHITEVKHQAT